MARHERHEQKIGRTVREYGLTSGTLGSTAAQTVMVAVFPILLAEHAPSTLWVGIVIAGDGVLGILVPYWVGLLSDRLPDSLVRHFGRRRFFLIVTAPIMALLIAIIPFLSGFWLLAAIAYLFFAALNGYLTPLWALMLDAVPRDRWGRVQGARGVLHAGGLAYGLIAGGLLFSVWQPLPFLIASALLLATTAVTWFAAESEPDDAGHGDIDGHPGWDELKHPPARWFLTGSALWTGGVDGLRPYFFLFAATVIGVRVSEASLLLVLLVIGLGVGSLIVGHVGDHHDRGHVLRTGILITGAALIVGVFARDLWTALPLLFIAGAGAATVMALPFPVYADLVETDAMGQHTGMYVISLGVGKMIGPILIGAAIDVGARVFPEDEGYPLMWPVAGVLLLLGAAALTQSLNAARQESAGERGSGQE